MNTKLVRLTVLAAAIVVGSAAQGLAADASKEMTAIASKIFSSLESADYAQFVADADPAWKRNAPKGAFDGIARTMAPRMKEGYDFSYLGELKAGDAQQTLWKLNLKGSGEEMLVAIYVKDGKVSRFAFPK